VKQLFPNIWQWSWFSEDKQLDFNGYLLAIGEHRVLIDPPLMTANEVAQVHQGGPIDYIVMTNRDHEREAEAYRKEFQCQLFVPVSDAPEIRASFDKTYADGELLPGGMWVIHLAHQKTPGECALFLERGQGILIVGDALLGKPPGQLSLLPPEKYPDVKKACEGLQRLLRYNFDCLLVGDGTSLLTGAKPVVERLLQSSLA